MSYITVKLKVWNTRIGERKTGTDLTPVEFYLWGTLKNRIQADSNPRAINELKTT